LKLFVSSPPVPHSTALPPLRPLWTMPTVPLLVLSPCSLPLLSFPTPFCPPVFGNRRAPLKFELIHSVRVRHFWRGLSCFPCKELTVTDFQVRNLCAVPEPPVWVPYGLPTSHFPAQHVKFCQFLSRSDRHRMRRSRQSETDST